MVVFIEENEDVFSDGRDKEISFEYRDIKQRYNSLGKNVCADGSCPESAFTEGLFICVSNRTNNTFSAGDRIVGDRAILPRSSIVAGF